MRGKMRGTDPGRNQKAGVVGQKLAILFPECWSPPDEVISRPQMPCGRGECKTCQRPVPRKSHILEVFPHWLGVPQIMMLFDEAVKKFLQGGSSHLENRDGEKLPQRLFDETPVDFHQLRPASVQQGILERDLFHWGKNDGALAFQVQQEPPADHVLGLAVWLSPVPCKTQSPRQGAPAILRVLGNHLPDKRDVRWGKDPVSESECGFHA